MAGKEDRTGSGFKYGLTMTGVVLAVVLILVLVVCQVPARAAEKKTTQDRIKKELENLEDARKYRAWQKEVEKQKTLLENSKSEKTDMFHRWTLDQYAPLDGMFKDMYLRDKYGGQGPVAIDRSPLGMGFKSGPEWELLQQNSKYDQDIALFEKALDRAEKNRDEAAQGMEDNPYRFKNEYELARLKREKQEELKNLEQSGGQAPEQGAGDSAGVESQPGEEISDIPPDCILEVEGWIKEAPKTKFKGIIWIRGGKAAWAYEQYMRERHHKDSHTSDRTCTTVFRGTLQGNRIKGRAEQKCTPMVVNWDNSSGHCTRTMNWRHTTHDTLIFNRNGTYHGTTRMEAYEQWSTNIVKNCGKGGSRTTNQVYKIKGTWKIREHGGTGGRTWDTKWGRDRLYNPDE